MSTPNPSCSTNSPEKISDFQTYITSAFSALGKDYRHYIPQVSQFISSLTELTTEPVHCVPISPSIPPISRLPRKQYGGICIGIGGIKGILMAGGIHEFWTRGQLKNLTYYAGSSAGSILASLLCIGYEPIDLLTSLCAPDFTRQFGNPNFMNLPNIYGFYPSSAIRTKLEQLYLLKLGYLPTFADLLSKVGKHLIIPVYCLSEPEIRNRKIYCSPETTPDMSVLDAVVLSCSIPIMFQKANYKGKVYIDGGYTSSFPVQVLRKLAPSDCQILGVCLKNQEVKLDTFIGYMTNILWIPLLDQDNSDLADEKTDIIELSCDASISSITFDLSATQKMNLFSHGTKQVRDMLFIDPDQTSKEKNE